MFVGLDLGGSGTRAALADPDGNLLALGRGPTGLLGGSGAAGNRQLARALDAALAPIAARITNAETSVVAGTRGLSIPGRRARLELELTMRFPRARVRVSNDAHIASWGGLAGQAGVVVVAGSGSIALARTADGREGRAGGWGYLLGDEGSGFWIGREAILSYLRQLEGRSPAGELNNLIASTIKCSRAIDVLSWFYAGQDQVERLASLAPLVSRAADAGDGVARDILSRAGSALAEIAAAAARQVLEDLAVQVVSAGGVWAAGATLDDAFSRRLAETLPDATRIPPRLPPLGGAVLLAMGADDAPLAPSVVANLRRKLTNTSS